MDLSIPIIFLWRTAREDSPSVKGRCHEVTEGYGAVSVGPYKGKFTSCRGGPLRPPDIPNTGFSVPPGRSVPTRVNLHLVGEGLAPSRKRASNARPYEGILTLVGNGFIHSENLLTTDRPKVSVPTTGGFMFLCRWWWIVLHLTDRQGCRSLRQGDLFFCVVGGGTFCI